jgi:Mg-chelatase subunit ChlI
VSGVNIVEREGISYRHPARFILVGTMNPEEGEVRPQLLDRFGLCVTVAGLGDAGERMEVVRRWTEFEADPEEFAARWADEDDRLSQRLVAAREVLDTVEVPGDMLHLAVGIAARAGVQGHRPDIVIVKTARALAALLGEQRLSLQLVFEAARLVLSHRMQNALLRPAGETADEIERVLRQAAEETAGGAGETAPGDSAATAGDRSRGEMSEEDLEDMQVPGSTAAGSILLSLFDPEKKKTAGNRLTRFDSDES